MKTRPAAAHRASSRPASSPLSAPSDLCALPGWSDLTPFQQAVLAVVHSIPKGEVRTYAQVAERAAALTREPRHANAFRAVGSVMRANPYAPFVPCHRVVPSNGGLGHYSASGGPEKKRELLKAEGFDLGALKASRTARDAPRSA